MGYIPIENYGVIGDLHTVALVGLNGSIDWLCFPHFDSPSVFAGLLDDEKGGSFQIFPVDDNVKVKQLYLPDTNVLVTRFLLASGGVAELTDFMPIETETRQAWNHRVIRRLTVVRGSMKFRMVCRPAFNYARADHTVEQHDQGVVFRSENFHLGLSSEQPLQIQDNRQAFCEFTLDAGQCATFVLHRVDEEGIAEEGWTFSEVEASFQDTVRYWRQWIAKCTYKGRWREMVYRSALVLKLLTFAPTGAIVAAPTTSLPEAIGGGRNWDYRYTWIRDASFTCYALLQIGFDTEAAKFMGWLEKQSKNIDPKGGLQIMYTINGDPSPEEITLDHLSGYRNSKPVRLGNGASKQLQLDIYGELMDSVYLYNKYVQPISYDQWQSLRELMNWVCHNWQRADDGLWEVRSGRKPFVYSRMMIWVALDRALRIAQKRGLPADTALWEKTRNQVYEEVMEKGWNEKRQCFTQYYGSDTLDASALLMPLVKFVGPSDPKMVATLDRILEELTYDTLVYRYDLEQGASDGVTGAEGTFSLCSFWLVEALTRAGRVDDARLKLEKMFSYANHLGLYAEEIGAAGEMLGNYPQAFTHLSLISATFNLDRTLNGTIRVQS